MALVRKNFAFEMYGENTGQYMKSKQLPFIENLFI